MIPEEKHCKNFSPTPPMLVNEISRLFFARMRATDTIGGVMTQDSARLLMRVLSHGDGCSQLQLVKQTHLKAPTVSVTLKRMEEEGLVRREQDVGDLRAVKVYLTESGKAHNRAVWERLQAIDRELMEGFSPDETAQLLAYLERMRDNILPDYMKNNS